MNRTKIIIFLLLVITVTVSGCSLKPIEETESFDKVLLD
jgi:hypothetical protein